MYLFFWLKNIKGLLYLGNLGESFFIVMVYELRFVRDIYLVFNRSSRYGVIFFICLVLNIRSIFLVKVRLVYNR